MTDGHFDSGNGYHGRLYMNPPQLCRHPSTIWRWAQDLIDLIPAESVQRTEVVAAKAIELPFQTNGCLMGASFSPRQADIKKTSRQTCPRKADSLELEL
jgi:hypothetical protein